MSGGIVFSGEIPAPNCFVEEDISFMEEYMERPRGVKMINTGDGHRLCTSHRRKGLYG